MVNLKRVLFLITILTWTGCVSTPTGTFPTLPATVPTSEPSVQVTFFTPELTPTETATNEPTQENTALPTATDTEVPTETQAPSTPTNTPTSTQTLTPTPTLTPAATGFLTPTPIGELSYPVKIITYQYYQPRSQLRIRDCPSTDCGFHDRYTTTVPILVHCLWYWAIDTYWGSADADCYLRETTIPTTWFAIELGGTVYSDPVLR